MGMEPEPEMELTAESAAQMETQSAAPRPWLAGSSPSA
jgi:hypothetical protein